jgi:hypothetical protein
MSLAILRDFLLVHSCYVFAGLFVTVDQNERARGVGKTVFGAPQRVAMLPL